MAISYITQFNKIVNAYMQNKLKPLSPCACFIGNLLNGNSDWVFARDLHFREKLHTWDEEISTECVIEEAEGMYSLREIINLEGIFLNTIVGNSTGKMCDSYMLESSSKNYEERLFKAMEVTLEALKKLHEEKGEIIENSPIFSKRELELV